MNNVCAIPGCGGAVYTFGFCQSHYRVIKAAGAFSEADRFWASVNKTERCWLWTGPRDANGYGRGWWDGKKQVCSRISWQMANGPIPPGLHVMHTCDTPACVNPDHLKIGTHTDNMHDMIAKGRDRKRGLKGEAHVKSKLTHEDVAYIKSSTEKGVDLAAKYGVTPALISNIRRGLTWTHVEAAPKRRDRARTVLTPDQVKEIRTGAEPPFVLAAKFGISRQTICDIQKGRSWKHLPLATPNTET